MRSSSCSLLSVWTLLWSLDLEPDAEEALFKCSLGRFSSWKLVWGSQTGSGSSDGCGDERNFLSPSKVN